MAEPKTPAERLYSELSSRYGLNRSDILDIISFLTRRPYYDVLWEPFKLDVPEKSLHEIFEKLDQNMPVAYITGRKEFYGLEFKVTTDTLIPRPETEILVSKVLEDLTEKENPFIFDLYTGSGCILLALLHERPDATGVGMDISEPAINIAEINAKNLYLDDRSNFIQADLLTNWALSYFVNDEIFLTANPPYVTQADYDKCDASIFHEPKLALVAEDDGCVHYKKILNAISKTVNNNVSFYFELGYNQYSCVQNYAAQLGMETALTKDLAGVNRVISGKFTGKRE